MCPKMGAATYPNKGESISGTNLNQKLVICKESEIFAKCKNYHTHTEFDIINIAADREKIETFDFHKECNGVVSLIIQNEFWLRSKMNFYCKNFNSNAF